MENNAISVVQTIAEKIDSGALSEEILSDLQKIADENGDKSLVPIIDSLSNPDLSTALSVIRSGEPSAILSAMSEERVADMVEFCDKYGENWADWFITKWGYSTEEEKNAIFEAMNSKKNFLFWAYSMFSPMNIFYLWVFGRIYQIDDGEIFNEGKLEEIIEDFDGSSEEDHYCFYENGVKILRSIFNVRRSVLEKILNRYGKLEDGRFSVAAAVAKIHQWSDEEMGLPNFEEVSHVTKNGQEESYWNTEDSDEFEKDFLLHIRAHHQDFFSDLVMHALRETKKEVIREKMLESFS